MACCAWFLTRPKQAPIQFPEGPPSPLLRFTLVPFPLSSPSLWHYSLPATAVAALLSLFRLLPSLHPALAAPSFSSPPGEAPPSTSFSSFLSSPQHHHIPLFSNNRPSPLSTPSLCQLDLLQGVCFIVNLTHSLSPVFTNRLLHQGHFRPFRNVPHSSTPDDHNLLPPPVSTSLIFENSRFEHAGSAGHCSLGKQPTEYALIDIVKQADTLTSSITHIPRTKRQHSRS